MNAIIRYLLAYILLFGAISCTSEDEMMEPEEELEVVELANTIWVDKGGNCDNFYDFSENTFISSNPCYTTNGDVNLMSWESGTFTVSSNRLSLSVKESCQDDKIGVTYPFVFRLEGDNLSIGFEANDLPLQFIRTTSPPIVTKDTRFGYFDFDNDGKWVDVESCESPY